MSNEGYHEHVAEPAATKDRDMHGPCLSALIGRDGSPWDLDQPTIGRPARARDLQSLLLKAQPCRKEKETSHDAGHGIRRRDPGTFDKDCVTVLYD